MSESTREVIVRAVLEHGRASQADIVRATRLGRSTVSEGVRKLLRDGLLVSTTDGPDVRSRVGGRPPKVWFSVVPTTGYVIGADVGHRELHVGVADVSQKISSDTWPMEAPGPTGITDDAPAQTFDLVADRIEELVRGANGPEKLIGIGLSVPAPIAPDGRVAASGLPAWTDEFAEPVRAIRRRLGSWAKGVPILVDNDATLGMLAETVHGAARNAQDALYARLSYGIGGGLLVGGVLQRGQGFAGEIGHVPAFSNSDRLCQRCGSACVEVVAATPALLDRLAPTHGELDGDRLLELEVAEDAAACTVLHDAGEVIGTALAGICDVLNPELVILGGQLSASNALLGALQSSLSRTAFAPIADTVTVLRSELGASAQMLGAIALVMKQTQQAGAVSSALVDGNWISHPAAGALTPVAAGVNGLDGG